MFSALKFCATIAGRYLVHMTTVAKRSLKYVPVFEVPATHVTVEVSVDESAKVRWDANRKPTVKDDRESTTVGFHGKVSQRFLQPMRGECWENFGTMILSAAG